MTSTPEYATTSQERPYQGYPYARPIITDVSTRKHVESIHKDAKVTSTDTKQDRHKAPDVVVNPNLLENEIKSSVNNVKQNLTNINEAPTINVDLPHQNIEEIPTIFVDLPENGSQNEANQNNNLDNNRETPTIYIDMPETTNLSNNGVTNADRIWSNKDMPARYVDLPQSSTQNNSKTSYNPKNNITETYDADDNDEIAPVVYIDINENREEANNSQAAITTNNNINETIYFDPFENRRIVPKINAISTRPRTPDYDLTVIPSGRYYEPRPAYTPVDTIRRQVTERDDYRPPIVDPPPRTQVITRPTPLPVQAQYSPDRKLVMCQHCGARVNTVVIRQVGAATHCLAWSFMLFCLFPITMLIYFGKCFKYKNHYCPSCSELIGYEVPMLCQDLVYVASNRGS